MAKNDNERLLKNLSDARKSRQDEFSRDLAGLRANLKPKKLADRMSRFARTKADSAVERAKQTSGRNQAAILAIATSLTAAALYKPVSKLVARFDDDSEEFDEYEDDHWAV